MGSLAERSEIVFFDLETTIPTRPDQAYAILEFGSILVCPKKLTELHSYESLVKPLDVSLITSKSVQSNGITENDVVGAPTFSEIADRVYDILHGRVWAGHNILRFDCMRLKEAYAQINRPPPVPKATIDTLNVLREKFGPRAGDMKMATLAAYFGLGQQTHRSLGDVRMNLEVVKHCAGVLFLESSRSDIPVENNSPSLNATAYPGNGKRTLEGTGSNTNPLSSNRNIKNRTFTPNHVAEDNEQPNTVESAGIRPNPFQMSPFLNKMHNEPSQSNEAVVKESPTSTVSNAFSNHTEFIEPDGVCMASITVTAAPFSNGSHRIQILHKDQPMQIHCSGMQVWFGLSTQFVDHAGRPRLSFVLNANNSNLCNILDACDNIARKFNSNSEWRPIVTRKPGFENPPTVRLNLPADAEDATKLITEIYRKESLASSSTQQLVSSNCDVAELELLIRPGCFVDAYFSLVPYNYQQNAGIRLVAKKLIVHS